MKQLFVFLLITSTFLSLVDARQYKIEALVFEKNTELEGLYSSTNPSVINLLKDAKSLGTATFDDEKDEKVVLTSGSPLKYPISFQNGQPTGYNSTILGYTAQFEYIGGTSNQIDTNVEFQKRDLGEYVPFRFANGKMVKQPSFKDQKFSGELGTPENVWNITTFQGWGVAFRFVELT